MSDTNEERTTKCPKIAAGNVDYYLERICCNAPGCDIRLIRPNLLKHVIELLQQLDDEKTEIEEDAAKANARAGAKQ